MWALIPAYLEARHIHDVVAGVIPLVEKVLVIDDGSGDRTADEARRAGAEVIVHLQNQGKGMAIKTGLRKFLEGDADYALLMDADGQHLPAEVSRFVEAAQRTGASFLLGNRMADTAAMPLVRRLVNRYMSWSISRGCGQRLPDSQCGFRMVHRSLAPRLLTPGRLFDYETEMLFVASQAGIAIVSVPVSTVYGDEVSKIRPVRDTVAFFKLMARYRKMARDARSSSR